MPAAKKQIPAADFDKKLVEILNWIDSLSDDEITELIRAHVPEDERVEVIPPQGTPPVVYSATDQSAPLRKTSDSMKVITDTLKLRNPAYARDVVSEKHIAFALCPLAFIEIT